MAPLRISPAVVLLSLLVGCFNPFNPPTQESGIYTPPIEPEMTIQNLRVAYMAKDIEGYINCFDDDSFQFYFDQRDDSLQRILKEFWGLDSLKWGLEQERLATKFLFSIPEVEISLDLIKLPVSVDSKESSRRVLWYDYTLTIEPPVNRYGGAEGRAVFTLKRKEDGLWYIVKWEDFALR